jgi:hypothetical protein
VYGRRPMPRTRRAVAVLAALLTLAGAAPGVAPQVVAASCSGWTSSTTPPPSIRVYRHATAAVETVGFQAYARNVLSREWIASWTTESLRSGALAVKHYAWYQVLHWRGGVNASGACFDVRDDTVDQVYDPSRPTYTTAAAAVDATWSTLVLKNGAIFPTYYNAGVSGEACGANANGWKLYQWGTQSCGLAGKTAAQIIRAYYYPNVTVTDAPPATPTPSPSPTPVPTAQPTPKATPAPTTSPIATSSATAAPTRTPRPTPTPQPTMTPTPRPTASPQPTGPLATPPPDQALPGGGQSGVVDQATPPPPPPADPRPRVARRSAARGTHAARALRPRLALDRDAPHYAAWMAADGRLALPAGAGQRSVSMSAGGLLPDATLESLAPLWQAALQNLEEALVRHLAAARVMGATPLVGLR